MLGGRESSVILYQEATCSVIDEVASVSIMELKMNYEGTWMEPIVRYLTTGTHPDSPTEAARVRRQSPWFTMVEGELVKRGFSQPLLTCVDKENGL